MKCLLGSIFLLSLIGLVRAEEFSLSFSADIINSAQPAAGELDALPLTNADIQKTDAVPPISELQATESQPPVEAEADKQLDKPLYRSRPAEVRRLPGKVEAAVARNEYLPIQTVPADSFLAQYQFDKAPWPGFYPGDDARQQLANGIDPLDQLHDEFRLLVGEDIYAQMVWAYLDVKQLDNWIYATVDQLDLFSQDSLLVGLNDKLLAGLTVKGQSTPGEQASNGFSDWQNGMQNQRASEVKSASDQAVLKAQFESQSKFFEYIQYLTPLNLIYSVLAIIALVYAGRLVNFLVRQQ